MREGSGCTGSYAACGCPCALPCQSFDLIFVFGFAHSVGDLEDILIELHRLLKPAGTLSVEGPLQVPNELFRPVKRQGRVSQFRKVG